MTSDAVTIVQFWWTTAWRLLTGFVIPGTKNVTPLAMIFFVAGTGLAIKFIIGILGIGSFTDMAKLAGRGVGAIDRAKQRGYDRVTSHANDVANTLSKKG